MPVLSQRLFGPREVDIRHTAEAFYKKMFRAELHESPPNLAQSRDSATPLRTAYKLPLLV